MATAQQQQDALEQKTPITQYFAPANTITNPTTTLKTNTLTNPNPPYINGTGTGQGDFNTRSTTPVSTQTQTLQQSQPLPAPTNPQTFNYTNQNTPPPTQTNTSNTPNVLPNADKNYTPTSESDLANYIYNTQNSGDPYASAKIAQATLNFQNQQAGTKLTTIGANGVNLNPTSLTEAAQTQQALDQEQGSYLDKQIATAKAKAQAEAQGSMSAAQANIGQVSREGVISQGNLLASKSIAGTIQADLQTQEAQLNQQQVEYQNAVAKGDTQAASNAAGAIAATQQAMMARQIQYSQVVGNGLKQVLDSQGLASGSPEAISGVAQNLQNLLGLDPTAAQAMAQSISQYQASNFQVTQQQKQLDNYKTGLGVAQDYFINNGQPIDFNTAQKLSQQTGLPAASIMDLNQRAVQISGNNQMDSATKQANLQKLQVEAQNELNGIFTNEQKTWQFYNQHEANWTDQQKQDYLLANGMDATNNPKTQMELAYKQSMTDKNYADANNIKAEMNYLYPPADAGPGGGGDPNIGGSNYFANDFKNNPVLQGGNLGCAWVNSSALVKAGILDSPITDIATEVKTLQSKGWTKVDPSQAQPGDIVVYNATAQFSNHQHIGTIIGDNQVMNNRGPSGPGEDTLNQPRGISAIYRDPNPDDAQKIVDAAKSVLPNSQGNQQVDYKVYGKLADTDFNPDNNIDSASYKYLQSYFNNDSKTEPTARTLGITGPGASQRFDRISNRANELYQAATGSSLPSMSDLGTSKDLIKANRGLLNNLNIQEGTVNQNFKLALDTIDKNGIDQNAQPINSWINSMKNLMGDPTTASYLAQNTTLQNELGNLIALKNASGTTVHDKLESAGLISPNATEDQQKEILKKLMQEAENGRTAINDTSGDLYKQIDPLEMNTNNPQRQMNVYAPKSKIIQNFLSDPNISTEDKTNLRHDLTFGGYSEVAGENAITRKYGNKYNQSSNQSSSGWWGQYQPSQLGYMPPS